MSELPLNWMLIRIEELVTLNPRNDCADSTEVGFVPLHLLGTRYRDRHGYERRLWFQVKRGYTHFADGDVLLARITPSFENGKAGIVRGLPNGLGAGSTEYFVCRPVVGAVVAGYLLAHFKTTEFLQEGARVMSGAVGQQRVPKNYVLNSLLPLAPLAEQQRIADKLDALLARVDACRARLDRGPLILKRFRQAVLAAATSGRLTETNEPTEAEYLPLSDVIEHLKTGPFGSTLHKADYVLHGTPIVNPMHINEGRIEPSFDMTISRAKADELKEFRLVRGDVVLARRGVMGRCAVVGAEQEGWICGSGSMLLRPTERVLPQYLQVFLSSPDTVAALEADSVGSTMSNLNQRILLALDMRVPDLEVQHEIVRRVEILFTYADRLEARVQAARTQVERLTPALLAKAFRGELVPQDPNDEPALALLERIRTARAVQPTKTKAGGSSRPSARQPGGQ